MSWNKVIVVLLLILVLTWKVGEDKFIDEPTPVQTPVEEVVEPIEPDVVTLTDYDHEQILCLAQNMYFEARGESRYGQLAVAMVTMNRVKEKRYPNSVCGVVWQRKQFSWTHDGKSDKPYNKPVWKEIYQFAFDIYVDGDDVIDVTKGATHYHAHYVDPKWNRTLNPTVSIETHVFYR